MKRILSALLCLALAVALPALPASAASGANPGVAAEESPPANRSDAGDGPIGAPPNSEVLTEADRQANLEKYNAILNGGSTARTTGYTLAEGTDVIALSADPAYTNPVRFTAEQPVFKNQQMVKRLQEMLSSARAPVAKPKNAVEVMRILTEAKGVKRTYILIWDGNYYLTRGTQCRPIAYGTFDLFMQYMEGITDPETKQTFYRYGYTVPRVSSVMDGNTCHWFGSHGGYTFRRLNGEFGPIPWDVDMAFWAVKTKSTAIPIANFAAPPQSVTYSVYRYSDGKKLWSGTEAEARSYRLDQEILYTVEALAVYDTPYYRGTVGYRLNIDRGLNVEFSVDGGDTHLGEMVVLRVNGTTAADPLASFTSDISLNLPPRFHRQADGSQIALFPVSYRNAAGDHWIEITCGDKSAHFTISAKDKTWQIQNLTVSSSTANETINSRKANEEYERVIAPLRSVADDRQRWSGRFILPVSDQKLTTEFGMIRYVNGSPTSERHGALDLAVPRGTDVKATGGGRVLYAGFLQLTGNTVLIEHGYGLKSWYYHMDSLKVKSGDVIEQGKIVGTVGSTGFSTGPHLHFGMSVNNVFVNPYTLINTDLLA